jgi:hypothetical protein
METVASVDYDCVGLECGQRTVDAFIPPGARIHVVASKNFNITGRPVRLTYVRYGEEGDYGHSSSLCGIEDLEVLLLQATWGRPDERPIPIETVCPTSDPTSFNTSCDKCPTPGLSHALLSTREFLVPFARDECTQGGTFGGCLECLCIRNFRDAAAFENSPPEAGSVDAWADAP